MWKVTGMQQTTNTNLNEILNKQRKYCMLPHILEHTDHSKQNNYVKPLTTNWSTRASLSRDCKEYLTDVTGILTALRARHYK